MIRRKKGSNLSVQEIIENDQLVTDVVNTWVRKNDIYLETIGNKKDVNNNSIYIKNEYSISLLDLI